MTGVSMVSRVRVMSNVASPRCTVKVTSVPASPRTFFEASLLVMSRTDSPSMALTRSPFIRPALWAGEPRNGLSMVTM